MTSILPNNTFAGLTTSHIGQVFFDQSLSTEVEATTPYSTNTQPVTTNAEDSILAQEADVGDPLAEYSLLGDSVSDGILAWIAFGINITETDTISPAATYGEDGGVANNNTGGFGGGPFPSGSFSSAVPTSTAA